ncbi:unnamed protein product [Musa acuminata var. zebrina]
MLDAPSSSISISTTLMHPYREYEDTQCALLSGDHLNDIDINVVRQQYRVPHVAGSLDTTSVVSWAPSARFSERKVTGPMRGAVGGT